MKLKHLIIGIIGIALIALLLSSTNVSQKLGMQTLSRHSTCKSATATSSVSTIASSTAPSVTLVCDAYNLDSSNYDATPMDSAVLAIQYSTASSTANNLTVAIAYSNDGVDWYTPVFDPDTIATTSLSITNSVTTVVKSLYDIVTPTRYVRATFSNTSATTSSVYAEFIPKKTINK